MRRPVRHLRRSALAAAAVCAAIHADAFGVVSPRIAPPSPLFARPARCPLNAPSLRSVAELEKRSASAAALFSSPGDDDAQDAEIVPSGEGGGDGGGTASGGGNPSGGGAVTAILERIDSAGLRLKPMALEAKERSTAAAASDSRAKSVLYTLKSCALFALFIVYRAYRGFFVLLPEVFRRAYARLESETSVTAPFADEDELDADGRDVNPETGRVRLRTRVTVSVLSIVVTASYVVAGLWRVATRFVGTVLKAGNVKDSFEAAADEVLSNEEKIKKMTAKRKINGEELE